MGKERSYIVCANNNYASRIMGDYARIRTKKKRDYTARTNSG